jgi:sporulation protein YabP
MEERSGEGHNVSLTGRSHLSSTGVSGVDRFDEETIVAYTTQGELTIRGTGLKISHLNLDTGALEVDGTISGLIYTDNQPKSAGLLAKLFR